MKTKFIFSLVFTFLFSSFLYSQVPITIATIPVSGSTGTIVVSESTLKTAFNTELNDGTIITSVSVEKYSSDWYLIGSGTKSGGQHINIAVLLSVSSGNARIHDNGSPSGVSSCIGIDCGSGCAFNSTLSGCTDCSEGSSCVFSPGSLSVAGLLGGYGYN